MNLQCYYTAHFETAYQLCNPILKTTPVTELWPVRPPDRFCYSILQVLSSILWFGIWPAVCLNPGLDQINGALKHCHNCCLWDRKRNHKRNYNFQQKIDHCPFSLQHNRLQNFMGRNEIMVTSKTKRSSLFKQPRMGRFYL